MSSASFKAVSNTVFQRASSDFFLISGLAGVACLSGPLSALRSCPSERADTTAKAPPSTTTASKVATIFVNLLMSMARVTP